MNQKDVERARGENKSKDRFDGKTIEIKLTCGRVAVIDFKAYYRIKKHKWMGKKGRNTWYALRYFYDESGERRQAWMHREILRLKDPDVFVDHIDGDGLNNTMNNLRVATKQENHWNQGSYKGSSDFRGVSWNVAAKKWQVRITANKVTHQLGFFKCEKEAAKVWNEKAKELYGEFARLNRVDDLEAEDGK